MHPEVTCEVMRRAGWPSRLTGLCKEMWTGKRRWLSWNGHVAPEEAMTTSEAMPQGDPFGPIALKLMDGCGNKVRYERMRSQRKRPGSEEERGQEYETAYEETKATTSAKETFQRADVWYGWSGRVGHKENNKKIQVVARGAKAERELKEEAANHGIEDKTVDMVEALGVTSVCAKTSKLEGKEEKRIKGARKEVQRHNAYQYLSQEARS